MAICCQCDAGDSRDGACQDVVVNECYPGDFDECMRLWRFSFQWVWILGFFFFGNPCWSDALYQLPELQVNASRLHSSEWMQDTTWDDMQIRESAVRTIDELLADDLSFSLYRRQSSLLANPTSAGVSLRNTGASAASRTMVLLDGIPQNDPFGGWVYWARYDPVLIQGARIIPASRAQVWGSQSPVGVIEMERPSPLTNQHRWRVALGGQGSMAASSYHQWTDRSRDCSVALSAFGLRTDGFHVLDELQRGSIDRKLDLELSGAELGMAWQMLEAITLEPRVSVYQEERGNGTPLARNSTDAIDFSLRMTADLTPDQTIQWAMWHQRREFDAVFSSVNDDRTGEVIALDQYDVPGRSTGMSWILRSGQMDSWSWFLGADARTLTGETNERVGKFRERHAGGEQIFAGLFGSIEVQPDSASLAQLGGRVDVWGLENGRRIESLLVSGDVVRDDKQANRYGFAPSLGLDYSREWLDGIDVRVAASTGFRVPTLNELHRPFRVRNDVVEANPDLDPERFYSIESGVQWDASEALRLGLTGFHHWIRDAIANVPVTDPSEIGVLSPGLPDDGSLAQRRNVDAAQVVGLEGRLGWQPTPEWSTTLSAVWQRTCFVESDGQRAIEGNPFPQAPELRVLGDIECLIDAGLAIFCGGEFSSFQYDDALAARRVAGFFRANAGIRWTRGATDYQLRVDNLFDEKIETGNASNGLRSYAAPRSFWLSAQWVF
ncbi:MAG: TonB-dependent receptor [Luteolibacter sp.]